jgi:hypothetical protein
VVEHLFSKHEALSSISILKKILNKRNRKIQNKQNNKTPGRSSHLSIINLNIGGLDSIVKIYRHSEWIKKETKCPTIYSL